MKGGCYGWAFQILFMLAGGFFGMAFLSEGHEDAFYIGLIFLAASFVPVVMVPRVPRDVAPKPTHDNRGRRIIDNGACVRGRRF